MTTSRSASRKFRHSRLLPSHSLHHAPTYPYILPKLSTPPSKTSLSRSGAVVYPTQFNHPRMDGVFDATKKSQGAYQNCQLSRGAYRSCQLSNKSHVRGVSHVRLGFCMFGLWISEFLGVWRRLIG